MNFLFHRSSQTSLRSHYHKSIHLHESSDGGNRDGSNHLFRKASHPSPKQTLPPSPKQTLPPSRSLTIHTLEAEYLGDFGQPPHGSDGQFSPLTQNRERSILASLPPFAKGVDWFPFIRQTLLGLVEGQRRTGRIVHHEDGFGQGRRSSVSSSNLQIIRTTK